MSKDLIEQSAELMNSVTDLYYDILEANVLMAETMMEPLNPIDWDWWELYGTLNDDEEEEDDE